jgi:lysophospholipase L1-like esterase
LFFREFDVSSLTNTYKIAIVGDSTASTNGGWASGLQKYIRTNISLLHLAYPWQSSTRFIRSERFNQLRSERPNYLFIQFGLMDSRVCGGESEECYTTLEQFEKNVLYIVSVCRGMNCVPVIVTPPSLNYFTDGKVGRWHVERRQVLIKVANDQELNIIDLNILTMDLFNKLGEEKSLKLNWPGDSIHFSEFGADIIAGLVAENFPVELLNYSKDPFIKY